MPILPRLSPRKMGPPRDLREAGPSGEVITYTLSPAELEYYRSLPKPKGEKPFVFEMKKSQKKGKEPMSERIWPATKEDLQKLVDDGLTNRQIAELYGVRKANVEQRLSFFGIRRGERIADVEPDVNPNESKPSTQHVELGTMIVTSSTEIQSWEIVPPQDQIIVVEGMVAEMREKLILIDDAGQAHWLFEYINTLVQENAEKLKGKKIKLHVDVA